MRLPRTDLVPVLTIIAGGVVGASLSFSFLALSPSDDVPAPDPVVVPSATVEMVIAGVRMEVDGYPDVTARSIEVDGSVITGTRIEVPLFVIDGIPVSRAQPLLYIDGVRMGISLAQGLDPDDVESVEIVKGDAAVALYGEEASVGVILISLKKERH